MELIFATGNPNKLREASDILSKDITLIMPKNLGFTGEIPETGDTIDANSEMKCRFVFNLFNKSCFADDTALEVAALGGAPGVYSARYAGNEHNDAANRAKLLNELARVNKNNENTRSARFRTVVTLIHKGSLYTFEGCMNGTIAEKESGDKGFGYDSIFIPDGFSCTVAEMTDIQKNAISHRGIAMRKLANFLASL